VTQPQRTKGMPATPETTFRSGVVPIASMLCTAGIFAERTAATSHYVNFPTQVYLGIIGLFGVLGAPPRRRMMTISLLRGSRFEDARPTCP
jgi:hypothetical protein